MIAEGVSTPEDRLPVVVVGAGAMGGAWIRMLARSRLARPVGVVDLDLALAEITARGAGLHDVPLGTSVQDVAERAGAAAVIDVTVPQAHRVVNEQALRAGLPVLCEKPLAPTVAEALRQVALADVAGQLLMVSQSRRYVNRLTAFRDAVRELGDLAMVRADFFHEDHEPGFREQMAHPLLVDMSIHHFDVLRHLTGDEPVSVRCTSWNPPWSWYAGDAAATAEFGLTSGARFVYAGSRCTSGLQTDFNGDWRVHGERGAVAWNGDDVLEVDAASVRVDLPDRAEGIEGSLEEFVTALRTGVTPQTEVRSNVLSLAMVEGAVRSSARGGEQVLLADLIEESLERAVADEQQEDVVERLRSWTSAADGLAAPAWGSARAAIASGGAR